MSLIVATLAMTAMVAARRGTQNPRDAAATFRNRRQIAPKRTAHAPGRAPRWPSPAVDKLSSVSVPTRAQIEKPADRMKKGMVLGGLTASRIKACPRKKRGYGGRYTLTQAARRSNAWNPAAA